MGALSTDTWFVTNVTNVTVVTIVTVVFRGNGGMAGTSPAICGVS